MRKSYTGSTAFPMRSKQRQGNPTIFCSPCGRSPTRQGRPCPSSSSCQTSPGTRWSNSSIPSPRWSVLSSTFDTLDEDLQSFTLILRWLSLEALLGFLSDFPSWASLMLSPISRAVPSMFYMRGPLWSGNKRVFAFFFLL